MLITNDVDEALLLADRIIPLTAGPAATLGPADRGRRSRGRAIARRMNHDARFKAVRNQVIEYLLGPGRRRGGAALTAAPVALANASAIAGRRQRGGRVRSDAKYLEISHLTKIYPKPDGGEAVDRPATSTSRSARASSSA